MNTIMNRIGAHTTSIVRLAMMNPAAAKDLPRAQEGSLAEPSRTNPVILKPNAAGGRNTISIPARNVQGDPHPPPRPHIVGM